MKNDFTNVLNANLTDGVKRQAAILEVLNELCEAVADFGNSPALAHELDLAKYEGPAKLKTEEAHTNTRIECFLERGYLVNMGQEWRVKIRATRRSYEQILLRAYISSSGYPIMIDLYEEDMIECKTPLSLRKRLKEFLQQPSTSDLITLFAAQ